MGGLEDAAFAFDLLQEFFARHVSDVFAEHHHRRVVTHLGLERRVQQVDHGRVGIAVAEDWLRRKRSRGRVHIAVDVVHDLGRVRFGGDQRTVGRVGDFGVDSLAKRFELFFGGKAMFQQERRQRVNRVTLRLGIALGLRAVVLFAVGQRV